MDRVNERERFSSGGFDDLASLASERTAFRQWIQDQGVVAERADELAVVFSELGANAVRASPDRGPPPEADAVVDDGRVVLEVRNMITTDEAGEVHRWDLADPLRGGGRGLMIVSALCDDLVVDHEDGRLVVRCEASV